MTDASKRTAIFVREDSRTDAGYIPFALIENDPNEYPLDGGSDGRPWYFGPTFEDAQEQCRENNMQRGVLEDEAEAIRLSHDRAAGVAGPSRLVDEITEIFGDVREDYETSVLREGDANAFAFIKGTMIHVMETTAEAEDTNQIFDDLATVAFWYFMIGREHALRGLPVPYGRNDIEIDTLIPDEALRNLIDDSRDE